MYTTDHTIHDVQTNNKMATYSVVLNDVLCFIRNRYARTSVKQLKTALMDFYDVEVLAAAKNDLLRDIEHLRNLVNFPHVPQRRDSDSRLVRETDDILSIFHCSDEQKMLDKLPRYVSDGPDNTPSMRLYEGDLNTVMRILDGLREKMAEQGAVLLNISHDVRDLQVRSSQYTVGQVGPCAVDSAGALPRSSSVSISGVVTGGISTVNDNLPTRPDRNDWALMASTPAPVPLANRYSALMSADVERSDVECSDAVSTDDYTVVSPRQRRNRKRTHQQRSPPSAVPVAATHNQDAVAVAAQPDKKKQSSLLGKRNPAESKLVAAKGLRKKCVFCIDNVSVRCTEQDIVSFVSKMSVRVLSCFQVNPRRRRSDGPGMDTRDIKDRKAFRLLHL